MRQAHLPAQHHHPEEASWLPRQGAEAGRPARAAAKASQRAVEHLSVVSTLLTGMPHYFGIVLAR